LTRGRQGVSADEEAHRILKATYSFGSDLTASERLVLRSNGIHARIGRFLAEVEGKEWDDPLILEAQAANASRCRMPTARRHILEWTQPNHPKFYFALIRTPDEDKWMIVGPMRR
jgi:hypothetical protein